MALNDVKEIQIPDSRYRQLEYIKFSGAEYVNTWLLIPGNTSYKRFDLKVNLQNITSWGVNGTDSSGDIRFNIGVNGNGYTRIGVGNKNTWADSDGVLLTLNTDYVLSLEVNGNAVGRVYDSQGTLIGSGATLSSISFSGNPNVLYIGASNYDNTVSSYLEEKVYNVVVRLGDTSNLTSNLIPCQRKSDNICGFYDTVRNAFYSMSGTTITDDAAGPIVAENMPMYVNKIESNNNIIWGSQTAFPYRRLEYIHFNGAEYIVENFGLSTKNRKMILDYTGDTWVNNATLLGQYDNNSVAENTRRLYIVRQAITNGNQLAHCVGNTWGAAVNASVNTRYLSTVTYTNASTNTLQVNIKNVSTDQTLINTSFSGTGTSVQNFGAIGTLGACVNKMANGTFTRNGFWTGKLYKFEKYVASTGTLQNNQIPCQRKSDGVCGLYDTVAQMFFPMTGTTITAAAAGPTVDEYWNLQA